MTSYMNGLRLYIEDRTLRRMSEGTLDALIATARGKGRKPKRWLVGATLISRGELNGFVKNYRRFLGKKNQAPRSFDQWVETVMNRPTFKPFIGNCEHQLQLKPEYDSELRCIVLVPATD